MIRAHLERIIRAVTGDLRFERTYAATVERAADDFVDVLPDDDFVRGLGLQRIPTPTIDPTTQLLPEPGCRCLLAFASGDPQQPRIVAWEYAQDSATIRLDGGAAAVARKGDLVDVYLTAASTAVAGILNGAITVPGAPPTVVPVVNGQFIGTAGPLSQPVRAAILGGAAKVLA